MYANVRIAIVCFVAGLFGGLTAAAFLLWIISGNGDWLGFAGGIIGGFIGGAMTVAAGYLAWQGVQGQIVEQKSATAASLLVAERARVAAEHVPAIGQSFLCAGWIEQLEKVQTARQFVHFSTAELSDAAQEMGVEWPPPKYSVFDVVKALIPAISPVDAHSVAISWDSAFKCSTVLMQQDRAEETGGLLGELRCNLLADLTRVKDGHNERQTYLRMLDDRIREKVHDHSAASR